MPKRKEPELDPKEQFKRFQETVKELGVDDANVLEQAFGKMRSRPLNHSHRSYKKGGK
jgi:hypothetical protein